MKTQPQQTEQAGARPCVIAHYSLDFAQKGEGNLFIWRQSLAAGRPQDAALLVDMNNIYLPEAEMDKFLFGLKQQLASIRSIAFAGCHSANLRGLKRKLKAHDVELFSNTAFFAEAGQARQWLGGRHPEAAL